MEKKKVRKFKPFKQFRILPGDVNTSTNLMDLYAFNCHRLRVRSFIVQFKQLIIQLFGHIY